MHALAQSSSPHTSVSWLPSPAPARRNPQADSVRAEHLQWVTEHGLVPADGLERAAWCHPDVPAAELGLLAAWYSWAGQPPATPAAVRDRARRSLWDRTMAQRPADWCRRFTDRVAELRGPGPTAGELPAADLMAHLQVRRSFRRWAALLVERAGGRRPTPSVESAFADVSVLSGDLAHAADRPDALGALARLLGCDRQTAVPVAKRLRSARLAEFEAGGPDQGLRDWLAGDHRIRQHRTGRHGTWQRHAGSAARHGVLPTGPTGLGTSAARPLGPRTPPRHDRAAHHRPGAPNRTTAGYPFLLPPFTLPWLARVNPHLERARREAKDWARSVGLLAPVLLPPGPAIWTEESFDSDDWPLFAALTHPDAPAARLTTIAQWDVCLLALDDYFVTAYKLPRDPAGARAFVARVPSFMPLGDEPAPPPVNQVEHALADLWARTSAAMPTGTRERFARYVTEFVAANLDELDAALRRRVPDLVHYLEFRRASAGTDLSIGLTGTRPAGTPAVQRLEDAFADTVGLRNDIHSYRKEIDEEQEVCNAVHAFHRLLGGTLQQAVDVTYRLFEARVQEFTRVSEREIGAEHAGYPAVLRHWMAGDNQWYRQTGRYRQGTSRSLPAAGPGGARPVTGAARCEPAG
ncbi:terpene synthase family protein [Kitasatospora sp. LaBMicrA B282]|uniref:terpene synthase family protein n=1 Tax=Kitasatospora sp. LaBMicrA B282 TaxID=3420949 RepID=UPI003D13A87D